MKKIILIVILCSASLISIAQIGTIRALNEINAPYDADAYPCVVNDGLTLYFMNNSSLNNDLYVSTRNSTSDLWGAKQLVEANTFQNLNSFWITDDELTIYFFRNSTFYKIARMTISDAFGTPQAIALNGYPTATTFWFGPSLTQDKQELYLGGSVSGGNQFACRFTLQDSVTYNYAETITVPPGFQARGGQLVRDDLHFLIPIQSLQTDSLKLHMMFRNSTSDLFETPIALHPSINSGIKIQSQPSYDMQSDLLVWVRASADVWDANQLYEVRLGVLNVEELDENLQITLYPNPVRSELTLNIGDTDTPFQNVIVTDAIGREVLLSAFSTENGDIKMDVSQLPEGVYFLSITSKNEVITKSFVKD